MADLLDTYPKALREAIEQQRAELKARQLAGQQTVGPWAPAAELKKKRRRRPAASNVQPMRKTG
ncbi:MAG: hypothetical protein AB7P11_21210 [Hydrogenophaga sp.]|uniref:hypothetical protein n=1 Tax=Hydrogenophaga sp. TaxID=1904254 RepID=UPI003D0CC6E9